MDGCWFLVGTVTFGNGVGCVGGVAPFFLGEVFLFSLWGVGVFVYFAIFLCWGCLSSAGCSAVFCFCGAFSAVLVHGFICLLRLFISSIFWVRM